jgi:hypothetical protein
VAASSHARRTEARHSDRQNNRGIVRARVSDPDRWRAEIRREARADRIKVRTSVDSRDPNVAVAIRVDFSRDQRKERTENASSALSWQFAAERAAKANGHDLVWLINYWGKAAGHCLTCAARVYVDTTGEFPVVDGEIIDDECTVIT